MNAVIIYDDFACAAKAKVMLERAAHRVDAASLWTVKPWRLDMLMPSLKRGRGADGRDRRALDGSRFTSSAVTSCLGVRTGLIGGRSADRFRTPHWPYGMVETATRFPLLRRPNCPGSPGVMA